MGKVFSWDELSRGRVPQRESFSLVASFVRERFRENSAIESAMLCGSFLVGQHGPRSDLDCVCSYDFARREQALDTLWGISEFAGNKHVPLQIISVDSAIGATEMSHLGISFVRHLERAKEQGGVIKGDPLRSFYFDDSALLADAMDYLRYKLRSFEKWMVSLPSLHGGEYYEFLGKALDVAPHVARKLLDAQGLLGQSDSKFDVVEAFRAGFGEREEYDMFQRLIHMDREYSEELKRQIRLRLDKESYRRALDRIQDYVAPLALKFIRQVALRYVSGDRQTSSAF